MTTPRRARILDGIRQILREALDVQSPLSGGTDLLADLKLDSIQQMTLVVELENHFAICFDPGEEEGVTTLDQLARLVERRLQREAAA